MFCPHRIFEVGATGSPALVCCKKLHTLVVLCLLGKLAARYWILICAAVGNGMAIETGPQVAFGDEFGGSYMMPWLDCRLYFETPVDRLGFL